MKTAQHAADHIKNLFTELGLPEQIVIDNGPYYTGKSSKTCAKGLISITLLATHITTSPMAWQRNMWE